MKLLRLISEYRWPIYLGGLLSMSVVACGVLVWVATRPDSPRPIKGYYEAAQDLGRRRGRRGGEPAARLDGPLRAPRGRPPLSRACRAPSTSASPTARGSRSRASRADSSPSARPTPASTRPATSSSCRRRPGATGRSSGSTSPGPGSSGSTRSGRPSASSTRPASTVAPDAAAVEGPVAVTRPRESRHLSVAPVACAHCGLAVPAGLVREGEKEQFCCSGCRQVYTLVSEWGFDQYYRLVDQQQRRPRAGAGDGAQLRGLRRRAAPGGGDRERPAPTAAGPASTSKGSTAPPASGSSSGSRRPSPASTRSA